MPLNKYNHRIIKNARFYWLFLFLFAFYLNITAQQASFNFRRVTTSDGLSNGVIRTIAQDKYGYTWAGTLNGLCRYDGYTVKVFMHSSKDTLSIPDNAALWICCDNNKNLWISFSAGLYRYDYPSSGFIMQNATKGQSIRKMICAGNLIYCTTAKGLAIFNIIDGSFIYPADKMDAVAKILLQKTVADIYLKQDALLYVANDTGLVIYDLKLQKVKHIVIAPLAGQSISKVTADEHGNTWMSYGSNGGRLLKANATFTSFNLYPGLSANNSNNTISDFFIDSKARLWMATSITGLCLYDSISDHFIKFENNPLQPMSMSGNIVTTIYQDNAGFIWLGTEGYGMNYFHPDDNLFHTIFANNESSILSDNWSRAVTEDRNGNLWLGSVSGVALYNKNTGTQTVFKNETGKPLKIYSNSVRSLFYDDHNYLWIGTSQGLNRYNTANGHMDFFGPKDSVPYSFFWTVMQDSKKNIWIGSRDGLYRFNYTKNKFENFTNDPLLAFCSSYNVLSIFEDSHQRLWLGTFKKGAVMYDISLGKIKHWMKDEHDSVFINNNIRNFAEDKNGHIWMASNEGIAEYDPIKDHFKNYGLEEGLKTLNVSELMFDEKYRLWIGSGKYLYLLDSTRKYFKSFSLKDGLPSLEFNEQSALKTRTGDFIYPTLKGFLVFNPLNYKEHFSQVDIHISSFKVFNKEYIIPVNTEAFTNLNLKYNENFFTLQLTGIHYSNPDQTRYAYKLEPFDKDWIYTKERIVNYTNVPGGKYIFHYKASADLDKWSNQEKNIRIYISTVFYKTLWFQLVMILCTAGTLFLLYRYRISQKEKIYSLQSKTQALEKEKAIVQYESLKQQLNPHFLFNSLTSLRSLIRIDKQDAADFLDKMSMNYRYILKSSESEMGSLQDELKFAQTYIDMQQKRFDNGLQVEIKVSEDQLYKKIVPVTLQNLIENAIKHNLIDQERPLFINIFDEANYLVVKNNIQQKDSVETSNQYGLKHLRSLYSYLDRRPVIIEKTEKYFTIKIPLI